MENVEGMLGYLLRPFFIVLYIGIVGCIFFFIQGKVRQRKLKKDIERLRQHIQTKLEIDAEQSERRKKDWLIRSSFAWETSPKFLGRITPSTSSGVKTPGVTWLTRKN